MLNNNKKFGLTCKEVAGTLSNKVDHIHWWFHLKMKLHLLRCETCSNYAAHLKMIVKRFKELIHKRRIVTQDRIRELEDKILVALRSKPQ